MVKKISTQIASKIQNFQNFQRTHDKVEKVGLNGMSYSLYGTPLITYFIHNGNPQIDINLHNFTTRTTISRVNEIINIISNGRYNLNIKKGNPVITDNFMNIKTEIPLDNYYNLII